MTASKNKIEEIYVDFPTFLSLIKVIKMLYGRDVAERVFTKKMKEWYNRDSESVINF